MADLRDSLIISDLLHAESPWFRSFSAPEVQSDGLSVEDDLYMRLKDLKRRLARCLNHPPKNGSEDV